MHAEEHLSATLPLRTRILPPITSIHSRVGRSITAISLFCLVEAPLFAAPGVRLLAQATGGGGVDKLRTLFGGILYLVMVVGLIFGVIKVIQGALALTQGEEGWGQIIGGAMIAAAPTIMVFAFDVGGVSNVAIQPGDIKAR